MGLHNALTRLRAQTLLWLQGPSALKNPVVFLALYDADPEGLIEAVMRLYGSNRDYTSHYVHQLVRHHRANPLITLYLESEMGGLGRARQFLDALAGSFQRPNLFRGKRCLDVGANAGQTLLAFCERGARGAVGVEIDQARYETARMNLGGVRGEGCQLEVYNNDILNGAFIRTLSTFDVIFCLDVIEHVPDPRLLVHHLSSLLAKEPEGFIYLKVGNPFCYKNVLAEPHYQIPGLVLLPHELAKAFYQASCPHDGLNYSVQSWHSYLGYEEMFLGEGLQCRPLYDCHIYQKDLDRYLRFVKPILVTLSAFCESKQIDPPLRQEVEAHVRGYLAELVDVFDRYRATGDPALDRLIWLKYFPVDSELIVSRHSG
jgi:2-polyprenyl-3-methyl-5-hydroxy-6-metoxy-1,4-benzoquinol methylase